MTSLGRLTFGTEDTNNSGILVDVLDGVLDLEETAIRVEGRRLSIVPRSHISLFFYTNFITKNFSTGFWGFGVLGFVWRR